MAGDFGQFGAGDVRVSFHNDTELRRYLEEGGAQKAKIPLEVVPSELDHGAGVPLYYFEKQGGVDLPGLIITYGLLSYENIYFREGNPQGGSTSRFEDGDNCQRGGSFPSPEPGVHRQDTIRGGQEYDDLLVKLLAGNQVDEILNIDKSLVEAAGECALRSIIMFLGVPLRLEGFSGDIII